MAFGPPSRRAPGFRRAGGAAGAYLSVDSVPKCRPVPSLEAQEPLVASTQLATEHSPRPSILPYGHDGHNDDSEGPLIVTWQGAPSNRTIPYCSGGLPRSPGFGAGPQDGVHNVLGPRCLRERLS